MSYKLLRFIWLHSDLTERKENIFVIIRSKFYAAINHYWLTDIILVIFSLSNHLCDTLSFPIQSIFKSNIDSKVTDDHVTIKMDWFNVNSARIKKITPKYCMVMYSSCLASGQASCGFQGTISAKQIRVIELQGSNYFRSNFSHPLRDKRIYNCFVSELGLNETLRWNFIKWNFNENWKKFFRGRRTQIGSCRSRWSVTL